MALQGNPFAGTDFMGGGGAGRQIQAPPNQRPIGMPSGEPDNPLPARPTLTDDPDYNARVMQQYLQTINQNLRIGGDVTYTDPKTGAPITITGTTLDPRDKEIVDQVQGEVTFWQNLAAKRHESSGPTGAARWEQEQANARTGQTTAAQLQAAGISAGASMSNAATSAGASKYAADTSFAASAADNASALERTNLTETGANTRLGISEEGANTRLGISEAGQNERLAKTQSFNAQENALNREIQRVQNEIAAGNLNLNAALGELQKFLDAQQYTLPKGAEYVPGFQPGGGVQEAARLAGVSYNPANYKANTVPFDPAAVVRQTMGR